MNPEESGNCGVTCDNRAEDTIVYTLRKAAGLLVVRACAAVGLASTLLLAGCQNLFVCQKASCPSSGGGGGGGGGSTTTDYVYVSNAAKGATYISEYDIGNGSLAAISGSPFNMGFAPVAMVVSPNNAYLYAATPAGLDTPGIYLFSISSTTGALSAANSGQVLITGAISSMDISPDGNFLFTIDTLGSMLTEYQISSGGQLARGASLPLPGAGCTLAGTPLSQTCTVKVAPSGQVVVASLGSQGTYIFPYSSSSGIGSGSAQIPSGSTQSAPSGDFSVTLDKNNFVYIARTNALAVYQITNTSSGDWVSKYSAPYSSGVTPRSVVLNSDQNYVFTANEGAGSVSSYSIGSGGALTQVSGSPFTGPDSVSAIGTDKSGTYMVAAGYNSSSGVQLFTIGTDGTLKLDTSAGTGTSTDNPAILAMTH